MSGKKDFKGYYFEYGWPEPYVLGVKKTERVKYRTINVVAAMHSHRAIG